MKIIHHLPCGRLEIEPFHKLAHVYIPNDTYHFNGSLRIDQVVYWATLFMKDGAIKCGWTTVCDLDPEIYNLFDKPEAIFFDKETIFWDVKTGHILSTN